MSITRSRRASRRRLVAPLMGAVALVAAVGPLGPEARADDYSDPDYAAYDAENMARTSERQGYHATTQGYWEATHDTFVDTWTQGHMRQYRDADDGRVYAGLGQVLPGGNVGDPESYRDGARLEVEFLNREGTKLVGNVWPCASWLAGASGCPAVVVTTGSIQVTQHMYGWLARHLQANGYTVFTYDVRGQGESETTDQANPFGSNPQDAANFQDGTVDALRFLLSSEAEPYVPVGWSPADVEARGAGTHHDRHNPAAGAVDGRNLGLIGHSLGAGAVSVVQQCTTVDPVPDAALPAACAGQRFPIRAIAAYDSLSAVANPQVPALDHRADGYFVNAVPTPTAPAADDRTKATSPYGRWVAAGRDACTITGRGFTHAEWSEIPYIISATRAGVPQAKHYTQAWLDRYVHPDPAVNEAGHLALRTGPIPAEPAGRHADFRATLFSGKYTSACHVSAVGDGTGDRAPLDASDLRAYAGVAPVGDWAALNAEREYGTAEQGAAHLPSNL